MSESDLVAALRPVAEALDALGVRYYLGGSIASSAHGIARASLDADIVAAIEAQHVEALIGRLSPAYYVPVDRLRAAAAERSSCNLIHLSTMFKIDGGHGPLEARVVPSWWRVVGTSVVGHCRDSAGHDRRRP